MPYFLTQEYSETRLMPSRGDAVSSDSFSLFSYRATASRLNSSEYLGMVVDYLSFQPDWVGYQESTKQGAGPYLAVLSLYWSVSRLVKREVKSVAVRRSALKEQYKVGIIFTSVPSCCPNARSLFVEAAGTKWGGR